MVSLSEFIGVSSAPYLALDRIFLSADMMEASYLTVALSAAEYSHGDVLLSRLWNVETGPVHISVFVAYDRAYFLYHVRLERCPVEV